MDSDIANGTCYFGYNKAAGSELVPCGNGGIANVPCCFGGDYCDANNSCYNDDTGNSYMAGCTDPEYTDSSCPFKSNFDEQEWVGLIRCNSVSSSTDSYAWAGCSVPSDSYTTLERLGSCDCTSKATLFIGEQALLRHASLPSSVGGTISWVKGYAVTASGTASAVSASSSSTATAGSIAAGSTASATNASGAAATTTQAAGSGIESTSSTLSTGAMAGIAVGSIGAVLSVLAIIVMVFLHRRRKRGGQGEQSEDMPNDKSPAAPTVTVDGNGGMAPPAYSGYKAELPGNSTIVNTQALSPTLRSTPSTISASALTPEMAQSEFGDRRMSLVSEMSNTDDGQRVMYTIPTQAGMAPIAELQG